VATETAKGNMTDEKQRGPGVDQHSETPKQDSRQHEDGFHCITQLRRQLLRDGFEPLPVIGKRPAIDGWQKIVIDDAEIERWEKLLHAGGTGLRTRCMPTFDADMLDSAAAAALEALVRKRFEGRGHVLVRVGKEPKRAIPFRTNEPFKKITVKLLAPNGDTSQRLELLADGQHVVGFGTHKETRKSYTWHGVNGAFPKLEALPQLSSDEARELMEDAAALLCENFGYKRLEDTSNVLSFPAGGKQSNENPVAKDIDELAFALSIIPNDDPSYDNWKRMGMAIFAATKGSERGRELFHEYSKRWTRGTYDPNKVDEAWEQIKGSPPSKIGAGSIFQWADAADPKWQSDYQKTKLQEEEGGGVRLADFVAYMPLHFYIFVPTREPWPATSVNARIRSKSKNVSATAWLDRNSPVEQMTWAPGKPMIIQGRLVADGGWIERNGVACFNLYRPPTIELGDPTKAGPWLEHAKKVYPNDADHIIKWLAFKVQNHGVKINHALVLGGPQGIGKDTLLEPVKHAVGPWNFIEVSPQQMQGRFNGYVKSVILRVSEARDLGGEVDRYQFYEHTKVYTANPPDVLRCDEKNLREHSVFNVCGTVFTTNHKTNGIYLPADDRRHYVAWSELDRYSFEDGYWKKLWTWYDEGGNGHVAAYLTHLDISDFDPKAPPPKTDAFWAIVDANCSPEESELRDALEALAERNSAGEIIKTRDAVTISEVKDCASYDFAMWLEERKNRRAIPHRFEQCGYTPVRNDSGGDGRGVSGARGRPSMPRLPYRRLSGSRPPKSSNRNLMPSQ
jgi:Primase C terminal 2 (PriCT-2)/Family of unknown function (DUF5906)/Bifunctional DNA primase/polymerase, N-terminal